jgi:periplasmic protein TonB
MNKETILKSDVLDILFDNRNKAYGAYNLRKFYNNRLIKSLAVMLIGVVVLSAFTFLPKKEKVDNTFNVVDIISCPIAEVKKKDETKVDQPKEKVKQTPVETRKFLDRIVITKTPDTDTLNVIDDDTPISNVNVNLHGSGPVAPPLVTPPNTGGGGDGGEGKPKPEPVVDLTKTFTENEVEVMPSYPGGMDALRKFLERNLENPRDMEEGEAVSVKVKFVVGYDGKLQSFVTVQDGGDEFNREVMRVLKKMPNWIPGKAKGQNVSVFYTIPIKFIPAN